MPSNGNVLASYVVGLEMLLFMSLLATCAYRGIRTPPPPFPWLYRLSVHGLGVRV